MNARYKINLNVMLFNSVNICERLKWNKFYASNAFNTFSYFIVPSSLTTSLDV